VLKPLSVLADLEYRQSFLISDAPNGRASGGLRHAGRDRQVITEMLLIRVQSGL
jgi:hypothetical protein